MSTSASAVDARHDLPFSRSELEQRESNVLAELAERDLDALIVTAPENIYYLTGYSTPAYYSTQALVIARDREPWMLAYGSERENVLLASRVADLVSYGPGEDPTVVLADALRKLRPAGGLGIETASWFFSASDHRRLGAELPTDRLLACDGVVETCRAVKSEAEIRYIREAAGLASEAMGQLRDALSPGLRENEIAAIVYAATLAKGGEYPGSPPYISSGPRVCQGHATWTRRAIEAGDQVYVELSACVARYGAALMRTFVVEGDLHPDLVRLEEGVHAGLDAALGLLRPGMTSDEADSTVRDAVAASGFHYPHESGYSIGIAYPPGWNETHVFNLKAGDPRRLKANMVFHLVPHTIVPGIGTVGLSETVLVTEQGAEALTTFAREVVRV